MDKKQIIYLWPDLSLLLLNNINASMHSHYAIEIYIALGHSFRIDFGKGNNEYQGLLINSNVPHQFSGNGGTCALILINPNHDSAGKLLTNILDGNSFKEINLLLFQEILTGLSALYEKQFTPDYVKELTEKFLKELTKDPALKNQRNSRIENTIAFIQHSYQETIRLAGLANLTNLSASRLRHLFKEETGITIRQYILNKRVIEAVKLIINGSTKTDAAHEAGFSDSAHLSRTFRKTYGLTLSDLYHSKSENTFYCHTSL